MFLGPLIDAVGLSILVPSGGHVDKNSFEPSKEYTPRVHDLMGAFGTLESKLWYEGIFQAMPSLRDDFHRLLVESLNLAIKIEQENDQRRAK